MKKKIIFFAILLSTIGLAFHSKNHFAKLLEHFFKNYHAEFAPQISYLRTDKTLYKPAETVWFQVYLRDLNSLQAANVGNSIFVEIFDPKGTSIEKLCLILKDGQASGQFDLPEDATGGIYKILTYSSWQKNLFGAPPFEKIFQVQKVNLPKIVFDLKFGQDRYKKGDKAEANLLLRSAENLVLTDLPLAFQIKNGDSILFFSQTDTDKNGKCKINFNIPKNLKDKQLILQLQANFRGETESFRKAIPLNSEEILMTFAPEGGKIVAGEKNKIAFRLHDEAGNAVQAEGFIKKKNGETAVRFCTLQKGLGEFYLQAVQGESYFAEIDEAEMRGKLIPLPEISNDAVFFSAQKKEDKVLLIIKNFSGKKSKMHLTAENGGKIRFNDKIALKKNIAEITLDTKDWATGASFFSLFLDEKRCAEIPLFINHKKNISISIKTDKNIYAPREKVDIEIRTNDEKGNPVAADVALAVVNEKINSLADDESSDILSALLLEAHLKMKPEKPKDFFDKNNPNAEKLCDLALMTLGKRHFSWENYKEKPTPKAKFEKDEPILKAYASMKSSTSHYNFKECDTIKSYDLQISDRAKSQAFYFEKGQNNVRINCLNFDFSVKENLYLSSSYGLHNIFHYGDSLSLT